MSKRKVLGIVLMTACAMALPSVGCKRETPAVKPRKTVPPGQTAKVALVMKAMNNAFFQTMQKGAEAHQAQHSRDYTLLANGLQNEQDVSGQIAIVEQMIAQQVDAIVIAPANSKALVPVCKKAADEGIVVINIDNKLDDETMRSMVVQIPFVGPNNRKGAKLAGDCLAKQLKEADKVAIIEGVPGAYNAVQRKLGFEDAMSAVKATVVSSQSGLWESAPAEKVAAAMITQHPDLKAILCANDSMALGAVTALESAGKPGVLVVWYDNIQAVRDRMKQNKVLCTIDQHADRIAVFGIEAALDILHGQSSPADKETSVDLITADSVK